MTQRTGFVCMRCSKCIADAHDTKELVNNPLFLPLRVFKQFVTLVMMSP